MAYAGAWKKATIDQRGQAEPLVAPLDPAHLSPHDDPDLNYVDESGNLMPGLPDDLIGGQYEQPSVPVLYLDRTPEDPEFGPGDQPGISYAQARALAGQWQQIDTGAVAAREYESPGRREGTYEVIRVQNGDNAGDSPETVGLRWDTGVGSPTDFAARNNTRIQRWRDRWIDMHWWTEEMRPLPVANAKTAPYLPFVGQRTSSTVSPYEGNLITDPDNWQVPQERRAPRDWDEQLTTDGTDYDQATDFGLTVWGL